MARRSRSRSRSRSGTPSLSRSRSRTPHRSRTRSPSRSRSGTRSPTRSRSRSGSPVDSGGNGLGGSGWEDTVEYGEFVAADEEKPTFKLQDSTIDLIRTKVYQAPALGQKYFNEMKKDRYMLARDTHESLEPKSIPAQVVASTGGMDLNRLHGSMLKLHGISRIAHRPVWALMEEVQKTRGNLKKLPMANFVSPPFLSGHGLVLPSGHVDLEYPEEERLRHSAKAPQNPSQQDVKDMHESLGVYKKYHEVASKAMVSMADYIQEQHMARVKVKESLDNMWSRTQDFLNMARFQETHLKEMRRSQLVKQHTKEFTDWYESVYMKDRDRLGARDQSDEIMAADYDEVIKLFNEHRKNKNTALKSARFPRKPSASASGSGGHRKEQSGRDKDRTRSRDEAPRQPARQPPRNPQSQGQRQRKRGAGSDSKDSGPPAKKKNDKE